MHSLTTRTGYGIRLGVKSSWDCNCHVPHHTFEKSSWRSRLHKRVQELNSFSTSCILPPWLVTKERYTCPSFDRSSEEWEKEKLTRVIGHLYSRDKPNRDTSPLVETYNGVFLSFCVPSSVPVFRSVRSLFLPCGMFHLFVYIFLCVLLREYMALHTTYPLHLTIVRTYTLITRVSLKGVMTQG